MRHFSMMLGYRRTANIVLCSAILSLAAILGEQRAAADRLPSPVEDLRQVLLRDRSSPEIVRLVAERAQALRTISDLSQALLLKEWLVESDQSVRQQIAERFKTSAHHMLGVPGPRRLAVVHLIGDMALSARDPAIIQNTLVRDVTADLVKDLTQLADTNDPLLGEILARSLGKIQADLGLTVPALDRLLRDGNTAQHQAAAEALAEVARNLVRMIIPSVQRSTEIEPRGGPRPGGIRRPPLRATTSQRNYITRAVSTIPRSAQYGLGDPDPNVRRYCAEALQQLALNLDGLIPSEVRGLEMDIFRGREPSEEERKFIEQLQEEQKEYENSIRQVIDALLQQVPSLARAVNDSSLPVRLHARRALEDLGTIRSNWKRYEAKIQRGIVPKRAAAGQQEEQEVVAKQQQRELPPPSLAPGKPEDGLSFQRLRLALPALIQGLKDPNVYSRLAAVDALEILTSKLPGQSIEVVLGGYTDFVVHGLSDALEDPDRFVRWASARTLGKIGPVRNVDTVVPRLTHLLRDSDLALRIAAASALELYGPAAKDAVPALIVSMGIGDVGIRVGAIHALVGIGTDAVSAVPALAAALSNAEPLVRRAAAEALGRFGPLARSAMGALRQAIRDPDPDVQRLATDALLNILPIPRR